MSIYGIRGPYNAPVRPDAAPTSAMPGAPQPARGGAQGVAVPQPPAATPAAKAIAPATANAVPVQPPQGTDPELWSVLTQDERAYFAKLGAMGPLTYGRVLSGQMSAPAPMARGGRLDVKA